LTDPSTLAFHSSSNETLLERAAGAGEWLFDTILPTKTLWGLRDLRASIKTNLFEFASVEGGLSLLRVAPVAITPESFFEGTYALAMSGPMDLGNELTFNPLQIL
jgi:hypothetical protein